ncbi:hypothetical protein [Novosphingobium kaempferiae]|uniref:hypothetical protein n=1 Tax=Novosphingobium kaempferiae TaxID=2896849 RepID=UPI001E44032D|nr:hypothetical protein [Novosphingobium kaempferiae]
MVQANWLVFIAALLVGIVVAYWVFVQGSKPARREHRPDVLDEGAAPAQRNQALIDDAPPASQYHIDPPAMAGTMAGIGEVIAVAAQEEVDEARAHEHEPPQTIAAEPDPTPAPAAPPVVETADGDVAADDLRKIKGLGPKMLTLLHSLGVTSYGQIAAWTDADLDELDTKLGAFAGRPRRDNWVEQARLLSSGDTGAYEAQFGKL